ncbi:hypothetical protein FBF30_01230 [Candidatus Saccharibacteria bacterium oral taxon 955]|nr:hypothetical protein FBF30_01230 [Candidatus Saccharibacteria bacterium oral taxon 955]
MREIEIKVRLRDKKGCWLRWRLRVLFSARSSVGLPGEAGGDGTVTVRERDTTEQRRVRVGEL